MEILTSIEQEKSKPCVLVLGNFDGVHLAHRMLITQARQIAREKRLELSALIFKPHPAQILFPQRPLQRLTSCGDQYAFLRDLGVDKIYQLPFNRRMADMSQESFVTGILLPLKVRQAVVGFNYTFGAKGAGNIDDLTRLGQKFGFSVHVLPAQVKDGMVISSTNIRRAISEGRIGEAESLLGYSPCLKGVVVSGERRGRELGFPTANLDIEPEAVMPKNGVYAVWSLIDGEKRAGMMNIGQKPTFHDQYAVTIEIHFIDYAGDLYGKELAVHIVQRIRDERKFSGSGELVEQLSRDREKARQIIQ